MSLELVAALEGALPRLAAEGQLTPLRALSGLYSKATLRTAATPEVRVDVSRLGTPGGKPNPLLKLLKPTVVLEGPAGTTTVAPYGPAQAGGGLVLVGAALVLVGGIFAAGYWAGAGNT